MNKFLSSLIILLMLFTSWGYYKYGLVKKELADTQYNLSESEKNLKNVTETKDYVLTKLSEEQGKNTEFSSRITEILGTIDTLDKLSKTDKELLQKYSKVYFLNEHYIPENLSEIPSDYAYDKAKIMKAHTSVLPALSKLIADAKNAGEPIKIISAYRSFDEQNALKTSYKVTYGSGANSFSADQGYSEHQLGTAFDFTTPDLGFDFSNFEKASAYDWLKENAYRYGFVLSYPENNQYYEFEPWHWRFVGVKLATYLHNEGKNFYDEDQRVIDKYLISIFD